MVVLGLNDQNSQGQYYATADEREMSSDHLNNMNKNGGGTMFSVLNNAELFHQHLQSQTHSSGSDSCGGGHDPKLSLSPTSPRTESETINHFVADQIDKIINKIMNTINIQKEVKKAKQVQKTCKYKYEYEFKYKCKRKQY